MKATIDGKRCDIRGGRFQDAKVRMIDHRERPARIVLVDFDD